MKRIVLIGLCLLQAISLSAMRTRGPVDWSKYPEMKRAQYDYPKTHKEIYERLKETIYKAGQAYSTGTQKGAQKAKTTTTSQESPKATSTFYPAGAVPSSKPEPKFKPETQPAPESVQPESYKPEVKPEAKPEVKPEAKMIMVKVSDAFGGAKTPQEILLNAKTPEEAKRARRILLIFWHEDKNPEIKAYANAVAKIINSAYENFENPSIEFNAADLEQSFSVNADKVSENIAKVKAKFNEK